MALGRSPLRTVEVLWKVLLIAVALPLGAASQKVTQAKSPDYNHRLAEARQQYFADLQGDRAAAGKARASFDSLAKDYPGDSVVEAYRGSVELLEAARTWAVWDKRKLANDGLTRMDEAVDRAPNDLEARFIRAASTW